MKFISWILVLTFSLEVMAVPVRQGLETAINNYEYSMVVDWNQKDQKQAEAFTQVFEKNLEKLIQEGLSQEEIVSYLEKRVPNKEKLESLKSSAALSSKNASNAKEIVNLINSNLEFVGQNGASWNGTTNAIIAIGPLVLLAALIIHTYIKNTGRRCVEAKRVEECGYESYCADYDYGSDGSQYCEDYDTEYSCEDVEECLEWEKKP